MDLKNGNIRFSTQDPSSNILMREGDRNPNSEHRAHAPKTKQTLIIRTRNRFVHQRSVKSTVFCDHFEKFCIADMSKVMSLLFVGFTDQRIKNNIIHYTVTTHRFYSLKTPTGFFSVSWFSMGVVTIKRQEIAVNLFK